MSVKYNQQLAERIYRFFDQNKIDDLANLFSKNATILHVPTNLKFTGPEGFKQATKIWKGAFSDARCEIKNQIVNDDYIVTEFNGVGTNDGALETPMGKIGPTGKKVSIPFVEILKINNEKVESSKLYFDVTTMLHQLEVSHERV